MEDIGVFKNGTFVALPSDDTELENFLIAAGMLGNTDLQMRYPHLHIEAKQERTLQRAAANKILKNAIKLSKTTFRTEYKALSKKDIREHDRMHNDAVYDLETDADPGCFDERNVPETDTDRGLPDERVSNNCPCCKCRPEMYSRADHARWKLEQEETRLALIEKKKTEDAERVLRQNAKKKRQLTEQRRIEAEQRRIEAEQRRIEAERVEKREIARTNKTLPFGWKLQTSLKFSGRQYYQYDGILPDNMSTNDLPVHVSIWKSTTDTNGNVAFGWGKTVTTQLIDVYSDNVFDTLFELGMLPTIT